VKPADLGPLRDIVRALFRLLSIIRCRSDTGEHASCVTGSSNAHFQQMVPGYDHREITWVGYDRWF